MSEQIGNVIPNTTLRLSPSSVFCYVATVFLSVLLNKYYSGDQIQKNEMGGQVARMGERCIQDFGRETWWKETIWNSHV